MSDLEQAVSAAAKGVAELRAQIVDLEDRLEKTRIAHNLASGRNEVLEAENSRLRDKCDYYMRWNTELMINCTNIKNMAGSLIRTIDDGMDKARIAVANGKGQISDTEALKAVAESIEEEIRPAPLPDDVPNDDGNHQPFNKQNPREPIYPRGWQPK